MKSRSVIVAALGLLALATLVSTRLEAAKAPERKTYFTLILGLDAPYGWQADCLQFTAGELCTIGGTCGTWARSEAPGPETAITFQIEFEESGVPVEIEGQARIDDRGKKSSLAGAALVRIAGKAGNFALAGRDAGRRCLELRRQWDLRNPPAQPPQNDACLTRAEFPDPAASNYRLPFRDRRSYRVGQTYCTSGNTHENQLAYDLMLPLGTPVLAARAGVVREIRQDVADEVSDEDLGVHNHVYIEHDDGSTAFYAHLRQNSVLVTVDQSVAAGEQIASSGASGSDVPLLHFGVYRTHPVSEGDDLAVSFRNAEGPRDARGGLIQDVFYKAMPE